MKAIIQKKHIRAVEEIIVSITVEFTCPNCGKSYTVKITNDKIHYDGKREYLVEFCIHCKEKSEVHVNGFSIYKSRLQHSSAVYVENHGAGGQS